MNSLATDTWQTGAAEVDLQLLPRQLNPTNALPVLSSVADTGLSVSFLEDLVLKGLYNMGRATPMRLSQDLGLPFPLLDDVFRNLKSERLCEARGSQGFGEQLYEYTLTDAGEAKAIKALSRNQYYGPAPVPFSRYLKVVRWQNTEQRRRMIQRGVLTDGFADLIIPPEMIGSLGPAVNSEGPILLHGPSGNGKTAIARSIGRVVSKQEPIWVPYVVEAGGQLIKVFDPLVHEPVAGNLERDINGQPSRVSDNHGRDQRWVMVNRPLVVSGGELTLASFELSHDAVTNVYSAPYQWKANGGTLIIDDFGRQEVPPHRLLDRWIVPMESHVDYLTLPTGQTVELPLDVFLILATNLSPSDLMDQAYLRRLQYRIYVGNPPLDQYRLIFQKACDTAGLEFIPEIVDHLAGTWYERYGIEMRACHPRDLLRRLREISSFEGREPALSLGLIDRAAEFCFESSFPSDGKPTAIPPVLIR